MFKEIIKYGELEAVYKEKEILSKKPRLTNLFWESTLRCNANCKHCGSRAGENINIKIENIKKIKKSNFNVILQVTTVTNKSNIKELEEIYEVVYVYVLYRTYSWKHSL